MAYGHDKYIVIKHDDFGEVAIMFSAYFIHSMVANGAMRDYDGRFCGRVISAGFVNIDGTAYGESESLGLESRPGKDTELLKKTYSFKENK